MGSMDQVHHIGESGACLNSRVSKMNSGASIHELGEALR